MPEKWQDRAPRLIPLPDGGEGWLIEGQPLLKNGQNITGRGPIRFDFGSYYQPDGTPNDGAGPRRAAPARTGRGRHRRRGAVPAGVRVALPRGHQGPRRLPSDDPRLQHVARRRLLRGRARPAHRQLGHPDQRHRPRGRRGASSRTAPGSSRSRSTSSPTAPASRSPKTTSSGRRASSSAWPSPRTSVSARSVPGPQPGTGTAGQPYASALTQRAGSHSPVFCMAQLMAAGVFDRFPDIRFYFAETNASWLPSTHVLHGRQPRDLLDGLRWPPHGAHAERVHR